MYQVLFGILYLVSLLPMGILHVLSDFVFLLMYHVLGYRTKIVMGNLAIAFPEKSAGEREQIAKQFYKNLADSFVETIKLLSISDKDLRRFISMDFEHVNNVAATGKNIQVHCGHQFNWEWGNRLLAMNSSIPVVGIYKKIENNAVERLFMRIRKHPNLQLVALEDFGPKTTKLINGNYLLGLIADQNPVHHKKSYWLNFFHREAPFINGPDKSARLFNTAVVFVGFKKVARGKYVITAKLVTENARDYKDGELTLMYRDFLEKSIEADPSNYLWSHRRWRHGFTKDHGRLWIDPNPPIYQNNL